MSAVPQFNKGDVDRLDAAAALVDAQIAKAEAAQGDPRPEAPHEEYRDLGPRKASPTKVVAPIDVMAALNKWVVTDEQVAKMKATKMIWRDIVASTHVSVWSAPGNGGKTTLARFAAGELAQAGHRVLFFQEDASAGDLPGLFQHAQDHGYEMLNSTLAGSLPEDQVRVLRGFARDGAELDGFVMFFDTLKKFADLMSKGGSREFFRLMRALTQCGATVVLLGHTNKHRGVDGKLIFEGVGDVRNDVDEMIYIEATDKDAAGVITLTMKPDKVRCAVQDATFTLDTTTMDVRALEGVVDVRAVREAAERRRDDEQLIAQFRAALANGGMAYGELIERVSKAADASQKRVRIVFERYCGSSLEQADAIWMETRLAVNNARHISLPGGR